jgi:hypothetical protein
MSIRGEQTMSMKRQRLFVPVIQVLLLISAAAWHNAVSHTGVQQDLGSHYASTPLYLTMKLNVPLLVIWAPFVYLANWALSSSYLGVPNHAMVVVLTGVFDLAVLSSVALFWYFVVVEMEMRSRGDSLIRFNNRLLEGVKIVLCAFAAFGSLAYAYWDGHRLLFIGEPSTSKTVDAIVGGALLLGWSIMIVNISSRDLVRLVRTN